MLPTWLRSLLRRPNPIRRPSSSRVKRHFRPVLEGLELREVPATGFALSGFPLAATAGVVGDLSVVAVNSDGSTDTSYAGKVHFASSDPRAVLPGDVALSGGVGNFSVAFQTAGTQTLTVTDTANPSITGSLGSATTGTGFTQPSSGTGGLIASSWLNPDGSDADMYAYDNFTLSSNQSITAINWRGGYIYNAMFSRANNFTVTIFDSILGGSQPLVNNPQLPETYLAKYNVGGNAGETSAGTFGGVAMYDYSYTLRTPFQAAGGHTYWVRIEAEQVGYPDWGIAIGTGGNNQHFQFSTGAARFSYAGGDEAFTLTTRGTAGVIVSPAATSQFVVSGVPASVTAGATVEYTVTAEDPYGNVTPAYLGTVHFSSSDAQATLPLDTYFSSGNMGRQSFTATFPTAGPQSLFVTDLYNGAVAVAQTDFNVNPAAAASLGFVNFPAGVPAGVPQSFTVAALDAYGNVATGYTGTIGFASSDGQAVLPGSYPFVAGDQGQHTFTATLNTPGAQSFTATDAVNPAITGSVFTAGRTSLFDFDSPGLGAGMTMPSMLTVNGMTAGFSSPNAWLSGGFSIQNANTVLFYHLSQLSGNYLYPNSVYNPNLAIAFDRPVSSVTFTYATVDYHQTEIPTTVRITAFQGATVVGSNSSHGMYYMGDSIPEGTLTFDGAGQTFDHVLIEIPWAPAAASDMLIDNIAVTTPNVNGVVVTAAPAKVTPTLVIGGDVFTYDGTGHTATAVALGLDGVSPVSGNFVLTYNGSPTPPTTAGTYTVDATFTSTDPTYTGATATGTVTINPATPVFSNLSSASISVGTATRVLSGHLAAGTQFPTGASVSVTVNGVTQQAVVDGSGNFSVSIATGTLPAASYAITYAFAGNGANFAAAANATGTLTVTPVNARPPSIIAQPVSQAVTAGKVVSFRVAATGTPAPTVQWQVSGNGGKTWTSITGATSTTLSFTVSAAQNGYCFRAIFTNSAGTATTQSATLTLQWAPTVTLNPVSQRVKAGQRVNFRVAAIGTPAPTVQWQVSSNGGKTWTSIAGATSITLSFTVSRRQNGYLYRAVFTNKIGTVVTNAAILVV